MIPAYMKRKANAKILVSGATGYIGSYTCKIMAAIHPDCTIYALSRSDPDTNRDKHPGMAAFPNIQFVQGDCLKGDSLPVDVMRECDSVVHLVGSITDQINYKPILKWA